MYHPLINIAIKAAVNAGKLATRVIDRIDSDDIQHINDINDHIAQDISYSIKNVYPDHAIISKKEDISLFNNDDYIWIINPIDGISNFSNKNPHFCISIAIKYKGRIEHSVIYDPTRQELFSATHGTGSFLNNHRIRVKPQKNIYESLIACNLSKETSNDIENYLRIIANMISFAAEIRHTGSTLLDLAYIACGRIDGYLGTKLIGYNIYSAIVLLQEAGGLILDLEGTSNYLNNGNIIAGSSNITKAIFKLMHEQHIKIK